MNRKIQLITVFVLAASALGAGDRALAMSDSEYLEQLKIADQHVARMKKNAFRTDARSNSRYSVAPLSEKLLGTGYHVGQSWTVAAYHESGVQYRAVSDDSKLGSGSAVLALFRYEVKSVSNGPDGAPEVSVEVREEPREGAAPQDARVESLTLHFDPRLKESYKGYRLHRVSHMISVSPDGIRSTLTRWEVYPLDVPKLEMADTMGTVVSTSDAPELPKRLAKLVAESGAAFDPRGAVRVEQDDFFGRQIEMLWKAGDPWPSYLRTPVGIAVLLKKEG